MNNSFATCKSSFNGNKLVSKDSIYARLASKKQESNWTKQRVEIWRTNPMICFKQNQNCSFCNCNLFNLIICNYNLSASHYCFSRTSIASAKKKNLEKICEIFSFWRLHCIKCKVVSSDIAIVLWIKCNWHNLTCWRYAYLPLKLSNPSK